LLSRRTANERVDSLAQQYSAATGQLAVLRESSEMLERDRLQLMKTHAAQSGRPIGTGLPARSSSPSSAVAAPDPGGTALDEAAGREMGEAILRREPGAIQKLLEAVKKSNTDFTRENVGLTNAELAELQMRTFAPRSAA